jgi:UDP-3-O-[3-hydroxymyristoyl] glucosamine N-acyltransferase
VTVTGVSLTPRSIAELADQYGGRIRSGAAGIVRRLVPVRQAERGDLAPLLHARYAGDAVRAAERGALVLVDEAVLERRADVARLPSWVHPHAGWALAEVLGSVDVAAPPPVIGEGCRIGPGVQLMPGVRLGARVTIDAGAVIGSPGFGWVTGPDGRPRAVPQKGGVLIEDDVHVGALSTIAAGTIGPTIIRRFAKLDAQVHVGHNCEIGEGTLIAAQTGLAGSVVLGRGVLVGGQVGIADHVTVGDGAKLAAKSGVIGDVPAGAVFAGYPAVDRPRWLRGLARLYRLAERSS